MMAEPDTDVVVVGAGACGLTAALRAAQRGAEVLLVEKDSRKGSNSLLSGGVLYAADTRFQRTAGIEDSAELMAADILRKNGHQSDPEVTVALCRTSREVVHWMVDYVGYELELALDFRRIGQSMPRAHADPKRRGGAGLIEALRGASADEPRITFADQTPGRGLVYEHGAVRGVACGHGTPEIVRARQVILACDGFGANREMLATYCPEALPLTYIGVDGNTGEGLLWALELGAAVDHMSAFQGHGHVVAGYGTRLNPGVPVEGGIVVDGEGHRFTREDVGYSEFALVLAGQPDAQAIEIFDERILGLVGNAEMMRESREAGAFRRFETLDDLARAFRLDPAVLRQTVDEYHRAIERGVDEFGRTRFAEPLAPPYYAARITGGLAHTQGGLRVDTRARVLRPDGTWIENLYAGGGTACGVSGDRPDGYSSGNGLLTAMGFGMLAAEDATADIQAASGSEGRSA